jgi:hypothetical protein
MECQENRFKDSFLTDEVIVKTTEGNMSIPGNLAHGCAMITLINEEVMSSLQNNLAGLFPAGRCWKGHINLAYMNERSF